MRAAVVEDFTQAPRAGQFEEPQPQDDEVVIEVRAAALSNLVRMQASGKHYSAGGHLPFVPGNDGVGQTREGQRVYFLGPRAPFGSMAERTVVKRENMIALPDGIDDVTAAALGNPGLATWGALLGRARMQRGDAVLVNGATGVSGGQAVQVARYLGARRVIATGRNVQALEQLRRDPAVDDVISLDQPKEALSTAFRRALRDYGGTQIVLDYLWGKPAELLLGAAGGHGSTSGEPPLTYVQIGSAAGKDAHISAEWLRSSGVHLLGSGLGSLGTADILRALQTMYNAWTTGKSHIETKAVPLAEVEQAWTEKESGRRTVFTV